jgi:PAS domain S-box-containing protein
MQEVINNGSATFETKHKRKDGTVFDLDITSTYMASSEKEGIFIVFGRDVTKRKAVENELKTTVDKFTKVFNACPDPIFISDSKTGVYLDVNDKFLEKSGYDKSELIGHTPLELNFWLDPEERKQCLDELHKNGRLKDYKARHKRKDGTIGNYKYNTEIIEFRGEKCLFNFMTDISEEVSKDESLKESEERFRLAMQATSDGLWDMDFARGKIYNSPSYYKMLGLENEDIKPSDDDWLRLVHPDDQEYVFSVNKDCRLGIRKDFDIEFRMKTKNGTYKWIRSRGLIVNQASNGEATRIVGTHVDMTERKQMEIEQENTAQALMNSEEKYRSIIEQSKDGIVLTDNAGIVISWNSSFSSLTGISEADALGKPLWELQFILAPEKYRTPRLLEIIQQFISSCLEGSSGFEKSKEAMLQSKDGSIHIVDSSYFIIDTKYERMLCSKFRNITERKEAETKLFEYNNRLNLTMRAAKIIWWELDTNTMNVSYDKDIVGIFGYDPEIFKTMQDFLSIVHPDDIGLIMNRMNELLASENTTYDIEYRSKTKSGEYKWYYLIGYIVKGDKIYSKPRIAGIIMDIDTRKRNETEIKTLLSEKELLLQEIHHRMKNSLNTIKSLFSLQSQNLNNIIAIKALNDAENRIESMMILYDKLYQSKDFSNLSIKNYLPTLANEIVKNFPNGNSVEIVDKVEDFELSTKYLQTLGIIVNELITNIMKYAFTNTGIITISASLFDKKVMISLHDNGTGMPESVDFDHSAGFGLKLINLLTKQLNGSIRIERGYGSTIILEFDVGGHDNSLVGSW